MYAGDGVKNFIFLCCCTAELYTNSGAAELPHALISASRLRVDCDVEDSCMLLANPSFNFGVKRAFEFSQRALWARWHARFHCHRHVISDAAGIAVSSEGSVCLLALLLAKDAAT